MEISWSQPWQSNSLGSYNNRSSWSIGYGYVVFQLEVSPSTETFNVSDCVCRTKANMTKRKTLCIVYIIYASAQSISISVALKHF